MLTTAVFAICLTAPLGAIFINTLGTKWLEYDGDVVMDDEENAETKVDNAPHEKTEPDVPGLPPWQKEEGAETDRIDVKKPKATATVHPIGPHNGELDTINPKEIEKEDPRSPPSEIN